MRHVANLRGARPTTGKAEVLKAVPAARTFSTFKNAMVECWSPMLAPRYLNAEMSFLAFPTNRTISTHGPGRRGARASHRESPVEGP